MGWECHPPPRLQRPYPLKSPYGQASLFSPLQRWFLSREQGFMATFLLGRSLSCSFFFFLITLLGALHCRRETHQPHSPCSDVLPGLLRGCGLTNYGKPEATCPGSAFVPSDRLIAYRLAMPNKLAYIRKEVLIP